MTPHQNGTPGPAGLSADVHTNGHVPAPPPTVTSVADLRALRRWIPLDRRLAGTCDFHVDGLVGRAVASHPTDKSRCGGFEGGISAEAFVREGGVCLSHYIRKNGNSVPAYQSIGWFARDQLQGRPDHGVGFCLAYDDCPPVAIIAIDMPRDKDAERQGSLQAEAEPHRDALLGWLQQRGCPTSQSNDPINVCSVFLASDAQHYGRQRQVWTHSSGLEVQIRVPGSRDYTPLYALDGPLPTLDPAAFDEWLEQAGFERTRPARQDGGADKLEKKAIDAFAYGEAFGHTIADGWCYDPTNGGYHEWAGTHWRIHADTRHGQDLIWRLVMHAEEDEAVRISLQGRGRADVLRGVESAIERKLPLLGRGFVAVANGVANLQTSELRDFDPAIDGHRAVTGGAYRTDWSDVHCRAILLARFHPGGREVLDNDSIDLLVDFAALALTGEAQRHTSILYLWGRSGGGKGGCLTLLQSAFGARSMGVGMAALRGSGGEIDATWVNLLAHDVLVVCIVESDALDQSRFLADTGDNSQTKRAPHGKPISGRLRCMFVIAGVKPPDLDLFSGFKRRVGVIQMPEHPDIEPGLDVISPGYKTDPSQDEADALITLAVRRAARVYQTDYEPPVGSPEVLAAFHATVDPLSTWLLDLHRAGLIQGQSIKGLCAQFTDAEGLRNTIPPKHMRAKLRELQYELRTEKWSGNGYGVFPYKRGVPVEAYLPQWVENEKARQRNQPVVDHGPLEIGGQLWGLGEE